MFILSLLLAHKKAKNKWQKEPIKGLLFLKPLPQKQTYDGNAMLAIHLFWYAYNSLYQDKFHLWMN